jgi:serine/threonine protein kinase
MIEKVKEACVHPNIFNHAKSGSYNLIITEMVPHGNICECLEKIQYFSEDITRTLIKQLLEALIFSKEKNILHGPVKGYDILIDEDRSVKLCGWT